MRIYVAAPWPQRFMASVFADKCVLHGHVITRRWWEYEAGDEEHEKLREQAIADIDAVRLAEVLVVLQYSKSEGKAVETGVALATNIPVVAMVPDVPGNIFHHHPGVQMVKDEAAALAALTRILYSCIAPLR